jgi:hypothetical protein
VLKSVPMIKAREIKKKAFVDVEPSSDSFIAVRV